MHGIRLLIQGAKDTGDWPGASEQWQSSGHRTAWNPKPFWDDKKKQVMEGCQTRLEMCCEALKVTPMAFVGNAMFEITGFDVFQQTYPDMLHMWHLGIFAHLFKATLVHLYQVLYMWTDTAGVPILPASAWQTVTTRFSDRLGTFFDHTPWWSISKFVCDKAVRELSNLAAGKQDDTTNSSNVTLTGPEASLISYALPLVLTNLIDEEAQVIRDYYTQQPQALQSLRTRHEEQARTETQAMVQTEMLGSSVTVTGPTADQASLGKKRTSTSLDSDTRTDQYSSGGSKQPRFAIEGLRDRKGGGACCSQVRAVCQEMVRIQASSVEECDKIRKSIASLSAEPQRDIAEDSFCKFEGIRRARSTTSHLRKYSKGQQGFQSFHKESVEELQALCFMFIDILLTIRQPETDSVELGKLEKLIVAFKEGVMEVLPYKSGELQGWAIPKMHELDGIVRLISQLGNAEAASAQYGEHCHTKYVKKDYSRTNRHESSMSLTVMKRDSMCNLATMMSQVQDGDSEDSDALDDQPEQEPVRVRKSWSQCDQAQVIPIDVLYRHNKDTKRILKGPGSLASHQNISTVKARDTAQGSSKSAGRRVRSKKFTVALAMLTARKCGFVEECEHFAHLNRPLALFLRRNVLGHREEGSKRDNPSVQDLNNILSTYLPSGEVTLWNVLEMTNPKAPGCVMRLRAYPWKSRKFHNKQRSVRTCTLQWLSLQAMTD